MFQAKSSFFCLLTGLALLCFGSNSHAQSGKSALKNQRRAAMSNSGKFQIKSRTVDMSGKQQFRQQASASREAYTSGSESARQVTAADAFVVKPWQPAAPAFPSYESSEYTGSTYTTPAPTASVSAPTNPAPARPAPVVTVAPKEIDKTPERLKGVRRPNRPDPLAMADTRTRQLEIEKLTAALAQGETFAVPTPPGSPSEVSFGEAATPRQEPAVASSPAPGPALTGSGSLAAAANPGVLETPGPGGTIVHLEEKEVKNGTVVSAGSASTGGAPPARINLSFLPGGAMWYCIPGVETGQDADLDQMERSISRLRALEDRNDWTIAGAYLSLATELQGAWNLYYALVGRYGAVQVRGYHCILQYYQDVKDQLDPITGKSRELY